MATLTKEQLEKGIQRRYEIMLRQDPKDFESLVVAHDYIAYTVRHPVLDSLLTNVIQAEARDIVKNQQELAKKVTDDVRKIHATIKKYISDKEIVDVDLSERLDRYEMFKNGSIVSSAGPTAEMYHSIEDILTKLKELGDHDRFLKRYIVRKADIRSRTSENQYQVSDFIKPYNEITTRFERSQAVSPWGALDGLLRLYQAIECYKRNFQMIPQAQNLDQNAMLYLGSAVESFKRKGDDGQHFLWGNPKVNIDRLHPALLEALDEFENGHNPVNQSPVRPVTLEPVQEKIVLNGKVRPELVTEMKGKKEMGYFKFNKRGKKISIGGPSTRPFRLLKVLMEPHFGITKTLESVFDAIKRAQDEQDTLLKGNQAHYRQKVIIENAWREVLKKKEMQGKIRLRFAESDRQVCLQLK